jgi:hypothetical protein
VSAHRRLTDQQIAYIKRIAAGRREAEKAVRAFPTNAALAEELHVSQRLIERVSSDGYSVVSRETNRVEETLVELKGLM